MEKNEINKTKGPDGKILLVFTIHLTLVFLHICIIDDLVSLKKECPKSRAAYYTGANAMCNFLNYMGEDLE